MTKRRVFSVMMLQLPWGLGSSPIFRSGLRDAFLFTSLSMWAAYASTGAWRCHDNIIRSHSRENATWTPMLTLQLKPFNSRTALSLNSCGCNTESRRTSEQLKQTFACLWLMVMQCCFPSIARTMNFSPSKRTSCVVNKRWSNAAALRA